MLLHSNRRDTDISILKDTCLDVQHKKRGRPRLRDDESFKADSAVAESSHGPGPAINQYPPQVRPLARVRSKRSDSFRSLRSHTGEAPSAYPLTTPLQDPSVFQLAPANQSRSQPYEIPMAFLDLDFVVVRANKPFEQIICGSRDAKGSQLADLASSSDNETFHSIRERLRAEREEREPAYMPPILQPGLDVIAGVSDADVDRLAQGFSDQTYSWTQSSAVPNRQVFPARVRLAKANVYFVVVSLPSFRPVEQPQPPPYRASFAAPRPPSRSLEQYGSRRNASQSAPPQLHFPFPSAGAALSAQPQPAGLNPPPPPSLHTTYHPPQIIPQYLASQQQPQQQQLHPSYPPIPTPSAHHLPLLEPSTDQHRPFTPQPPPSSLPPPHGGAVSAATALQLPPINHPPVSATMTGPSGYFRTLEAQQQGAGWSSEGDEGPSSKRQRRMGIDDVVHR